MYTIGFWECQLGERGTTVALYDYAFHNEKMLGNKSIIFYDKNSQNNVDTVIEKFKNIFTVYAVEDYNDVDMYITKHNVSMLYVLKFGLEDNKYSRLVKTFVHCVFNTSQPHGNIYAAISDAVTKYRPEIPILPHMIDIPNHDENMRGDLGIPENALVYGRYGGRDQFDISFVHLVVYRIALNNPNIYFVFANTNPFCPPLKNVIHLKTIVDCYEKRKFINTCDAMLWARFYGETFGLSIAEFSTCNKPIIAYMRHDVESNFHIKTLNNNAFWFENSDDLIQILQNFDKDKEENKDWNMYKEYTPEKVMQIFQKLVIDAISSP
jgi:hypothetical protein